MIKNGLVTALILFTAVSALFAAKLSIASAADLTTDLVSYWKLDETSGTRFDSVGTNNLTSNNSVGTSTGKIGTAAHFTSASSQYLSIPDNTSISVGNIDFTVAAWVYLDAKDVDRGVVGQYFTTTNERSWNVGYTNNLFRFGVSGDGTSAGFGAVQTNNLSNIATSTWYYLVAWYDSVNSTINIQVNNGAVNTASWTAGVHDSAGPFTIGALGNPLQFLDGRVDGVGLWKRVLSSGERTDLYSAGNGLDYPFIEPDNITITSPVDYQVFQRDSNGNADIAISGTYHGSPATIEASWNGGPFTTIDSNPTGETFSGTLSGERQGQGTLTVRFSNDHSLNSSRQYVGIGDIFVIAGQSNGSGRALNSQVYSHPTLKASLFGNDDVWKDLVDPTDAMTNQVDSVSLEDSSVLTTGFGSAWPLVATAYMEDQGVPVAFIPAAKGGTSITQWQPEVSNHGDAATLYGSMYRRINAAGGSVKAILFWQGEDDIGAGTSRSTYLSKLESFSDAVQDDFGIKTIAAQIGPYGNQATTSINNIRLAQSDAWAAGTSVLPGPTLYDVNITDSLFHVHFKTDSDIKTAADRWWASIAADLFQGEDGRGPRLGTATVNSAKTKVLLTFTDESLPLLPASGLSTQAFTVKDGGVSVPISAADRISQNQIELSLLSAASGSLSVSLGQGNGAQGLTVPTDSSTFALPAEIFIDQSVSVDSAVPTISSVAASSTEASAVVSWSTDENADSEIEYGTTADYGSSTALDPDLVTSHSFTLEGLSSGVTYHYRVISADPFSNSATSSDHTFDTAASPASSAAPAHRQYGSGRHSITSLLTATERQGLIVEVRSHLIDLITQLIALLRLQLAR